VIASPIRATPPRIRLAMKASGGAERGAWLWESAADKATMDSMRDRTAIGKSACTGIHRKLNFMSPIENESAAWDN
jgi:hypothetical protein